MAPALRKRARTTESNAGNAAQTSSLPLSSLTFPDTFNSSRLKRRALFPIANDENVDPNGIFDVRNGDGQLGPDKLNFGTCQTNILPQIASPKRRKKIALSPTKVQGSNNIDEEVSEGNNAVQLLTPKTPRHRDALSKRVPITPRHKIGLVGKKLTPSTPRTPSISSKAPTIYHCARQLFTRSADPGPLVGREDERRALHTFIEDGISSKAGRGLYVSGPPGTGKSALVSEVCRNVKGFRDVRTAYINCMSAEKSKDVYGKLLEELVGEIEVEDGMSHLQAVLVPRKRYSDCVYVVILDEIDHLLTLDLDVLYQLFEWSLHKRSRLILIGIANALDLTDRFSPRLKAKNLKPQLLPFLPYTAPQIASVVSTKLKSLLPGDSTGPSDHVPFVQPTAIQLCSKKVASQGGDLRKAFDIMRRTIDLIEIEVKQKFQDDIGSRITLLSPSKTPLGENPNLSSPSRTTLTFEASLAGLTPFTAPRATIAHLSRVSAAALSNGTSQRIQTLHLQQKAILCALISHQKSSRKAVSSMFATPSKACCAPLVRSVFETYCSLCKRDNVLQPLANTEFLDIISGLETLGLVGEQNSVRSSSMPSGTPSKKSKVMGDGKRVICFVDEEELKGCLRGAGREILLGLLNRDQ